MTDKLDRREFLQKGTAAAMAAAAVGAAGSAIAAEEKKDEKKAGKQIRVGVIGVGGRGRWHITNLLTNHPDVTITAICDIKQDRLKMAIDIVKQMRGTTPAGYSKDEYDYRNLCARDDVDGVLCATPSYWLGRMTVDAVKAGKHAAHEVNGAQTEEECWGMVKEKEKSGKHVMLLENCCYGNENMTVYNMIGQGVFGETYYSECSYVHDCRGYFFEGDGKITWRGELVRDAYGSAYPQHGLGSACKWLGINDGDRMEYCQTMMSAPREAHAWAVEKFGPDSTQAKVDFKCGDFVSSLIYTAKGKMIRVDYSLTNSRPYSRYYVIQGMNGCWDSRSGIYIKGISKSENWDPIADYYPKYQHAYWRKEGAVAQKFGGHGGIDFYCIHDFVKMIREDKEPWIDVYDAAAWSAIIFCSKLSLDRKGARVDMPDFTEGRWKDPNWRKDRMPIG